MNKFQKGLVTLLATVTAATSVVGLASCGGNGGGTPAPEVAVEAYDGSKVTITFSHSMGQTLQAAVELYIKEFNKIYPNITVKPSKDADDYDTLFNNLSIKLNGNQDYVPHVAYCYPDHVASYNRGKRVMNLDPYINSTEKVANTEETMGFTQAQIDDYYEVFYAEGQDYGDGNTYSLPFYKSTEVMYYNKDFFTKHNLKVPTTWEEMETVCAQIKAIDSKCIPLGYDSEANWFITMTEQIGKNGYTSATGNYFNFNTQENRDFVEKFASWYNKGYVTTRGIYENYTSNLFNVLDSESENKTNCYMCIGSTGGAAYQVGEKVDLGGDQPEYAFEVGVTQVPQLDSSKPKIIQQGPSICLFKKANAQEVAAAWLFAKFFTSNPAFQAYSSLKNGYTPVVKSAILQPGYQTQLNGLNEAVGKERNAYLQVAVVQQTVDQMDSYFTSAVFKGSSKARETVGELMANCFQYAKGDGAKKYIEDKFAAAVKDLEYTFGKGTN